MRYATSYRLSFETLSLYYNGPLTAISDILDQMRLKLRMRMYGHNEVSEIKRPRQMRLEEITTGIRPYPTEIGESCKNGFDKLIPRLGIEIIVSSDDRIPARIDPEID